MNTLSKSEFKEVVRNTPLVSIDLIIENKEGDILLGWRSNSPAKGFWFVPGGRIFKDEPLDLAFKRIAETETGCKLAMEDAIFLGVYQHLYPNENFTGEEDFGTHYIVLAYRVKIENFPDKLPQEQHTDYWRASLDEILGDPNIHKNTKNYFNGYPSFSD